MIAFGSKFLFSNFKSLLGILSGKYFSHHEARFVFKNALNIAILLQFVFENAQMEKVQKKSRNLSILSANRECTPPIFFFTFYELLGFLSARSMRALIHLAFCHYRQLVAPFPQIHD